MRRAQCLIAIRCSERAFVCSSLHIHSASFSPEDCLFEDSWPGLECLPGVVDTMVVKSPSPQDRQTQVLHHLPRHIRKSRQEPNCRSSLRREARLMRSELHLKHLCSLLPRARSSCRIDLQNRGVSCSIDHSQDCGLTATLCCNRCVYHR